jgi:hypothetical protein
MIFFLLPPYSPERKDLGVGVEKREKESKVAIDETNQAISHSRRTKPVGPRATGRGYPGATSAN